MLNTTFFITSNLRTNTFRSFRFFYKQNKLVQRLISVVVVHHLSPFFPFSPHPFHVEQTQHLYQSTSNTNLFPFVQFHKFLNKQIFFFFNKKHQCFTLTAKPTNITCNGYPSCRIQMHMITIFNIFTVNCIGKNTFRAKCST